MEQAIYFVNAFANQRFQGNPAAVCPLDTWLPDTTMQAIATELNLSETVFFVGHQERFHIRWFTPKKEVKLCGHATLASAHVIYNHLDHPQTPITFDSLSGPLHVDFIDTGLVMNFPCNAAENVAPPDNIGVILGAQPSEVLTNDDLICVFESPDIVRNLTPDISAIKRLAERGVAVTAPDTGEFDFICRFFAPNVGIEEDPVTGSLYTKLTPYYAKRLDKNAFVAYQASSRGGVVNTQLVGDRVEISGRCITSICGTMYL